MSRGQRLVLIAVAVAVAVAAFVVARPDGGEPGAPPRDATRQPSTPADDPTATTDSRPEIRIRLRDHRPSGGARRISAKKGELVRIVVESDAPDEIHLHGYDIGRKATPGSPARFSFRADIEGAFELESHELEREAADPVIARVVVEPA